MTPPPTECSTIKSATERRVLLKWLAAASAIVALICCANKAEAGADTVYVNGKIITVDKAFTIAQAVAVKDGRFVGVGTSDEMRSYDRRHTRSST